MKTTAIFVAEIEGRECPVIKDATTNEVIATLEPSIYFKGEAGAHAEFIVRACNSYDAMREALEAIYAGVSDGRRAELDTYSNPDALLVQLPVLWGAIRKVRDALKSAKGETL